MPKIKAKYLGCFTNLAVIQYGKTIYLTDNMYIEWDENSFYLDDVPKGTTFPISALSEWQWSGSINDLKKLMKLVGLSSC